MSLLETQQSKRSNSISKEEMQEQCAALIIQQVPWWATLMEEAPVHFPQHLINFKAHNLVVVWVTNNLIPDSLLWVAEQVKCHLVINLTLVMTEWWVVYHWIIPIWWEHRGLRPIFKKEILDNLVKISWDNFIELRELSLLLKLESSIMKIIH